MITYMSIDGLHPIEIGHVSDNLTRRVEIDCSAWKRKYPALTRFEICVTRPDGMIYCPKTEVNSAGKLVWVITDAETAIPGEGSYQVIGTGRYGDRRASRPAGLSIEANMPGIDSERAPDPSKPWVKKVFDAAAAAEQFAKDAAVSAETMLHPPIIGENGNWWLWDNEQKAYTDSGFDSRPAAAPYTLPTASESVKGGVKVGDGLQMTGDVLGVVPEGEYELIETITIEESTRAIIRTEFPDGAPLALKNVFIYIDPAVASTTPSSPSMLVYVGDGNNNWYAELSLEKTLSTSERNKAWTTFLIHCGRLFPINSRGQTYSPTILTSYAGIPPLAKTLKRIWIKPVNTNDVIPVGSVITIMGVRA